MSQIKMDSEDIATIRDALQVIQGNTEVVCSNVIPAELYNREKETMRQVKRIDGLLPQVKFEEGK